MKALTTSQLDLPPPKDSPARDDFFYAQTRLPTTHGLFDMRVYIEEGGREHLAISVGNLRQAQNLPLRIHSECLTSEVFGSLKCDCKQQLGDEITIPNSIDTVLREGAEAEAALKQNA